MDYYVNETDPGLVVVSVGPEPVELDDVRMYELREVLEDELDLLLLRLEVLALRELHLVPHHLHALLRVHGEVRAVDSRHISLVHLQTPHETRLATRIILLTVSCKLTR